MLDLFKAELETNSEVLNKELLELESNPDDLEKINALMRAAHSLKGAAKILQLEPFVKLSHVMEDVFVSVQEGKYSISPDSIDVLLTGVDLFVACSKEEDNLIPKWIEENIKEIEKTSSRIEKLLTQKTPRKEKKSAAKSQKIEEKKEDVHEPVKEKIDTSKEEKKESAPADDDTDYSMVTLFKIELENQSGILNKGLLTLENDPGSLDEVEQLMRASHSIKGAARILGFNPVVNIAHLMEDYFVGLQEEKVQIHSSHIDTLLSAVDIFTSLAEKDEREIDSWLKENNDEIARMTLSLSGLFEETPSDEAENKVEDKQPAHKEVSAPGKHSTGKLKKDSEEIESDRILRVSSESLNKLVGLAGESLVESRRLQNYVNELSRIKNSQSELSKLIEKIYDVVTTEKAGSRIEEYLIDAQNKVLELKNINSSFITDFEIFTGKSSSLSNRLYREVLLSRMRPFEEGVNDFPRMVRDLGRQLNKRVQLLIEGASTKVDRDILEKLKAPLTHLVRNAVDHGVESGEERIKAGKPEEGTLKLSASHRAGMLYITLKDDGGGIDIEKIKKKIIEKNYVTEDMAAELTDSETTDFLFLPGFSTSQKVTEISGRGVGLDVVQNMIQEVGGIVRVDSKFGEGTTFTLQLPITLSVVRTLIMEVAGEPYAIPLTRIDYAIKIRIDKVNSVEGKQFFEYNKEKIGIIKASQILGKNEAKNGLNYLNIVVISDRVNKFGLIVDKLLGERDLVVHRLDSRLGKIKDISAASVLEDGEPVLIFDVEDLVKSIEDLLEGKELSKVSGISKAKEQSNKKRILVVDDSITVREVEKKLLESYGYEVNTAVNGMDGWNSVRGTHYDLIISDIDMPRMNGFEFVTLVRKNEKTHDVPVIIVSYKDREEDKLKGMEAGANYYLTKSSFHDDTFIEAVKDLIGEPEE